MAAYRTLKITRKQLREAIAAGIEAAEGALTKPQERKLRLLGASAMLLATGTYFYEPARCGCPLRRTGIATGNEVTGNEVTGMRGRWQAASDFADGYDQYLRNLYLDRRRAEANRRGGSLDWSEWPVSSPSVVRVVD